MSENLVTLEEAMRDLRLTMHDNIDDLELKISLASGIVAEYVKKPDHEWTPETAPDGVKAATLLTIRALYDGDGGIPDRARDYLVMHRDPSLA